MIIYIYIWREREREHPAGDTRHVVSRAQTPYTLHSTPHSTHLGCADAPTYVLDTPTRADCARYLVALC